MALKLAGRWLLDISLRRLRTTKARQEAEGKEAERMASRLAPANAAVTMLDVSVWLLGAEARLLLFDQIKQHGLGF